MTNERLTADMLPYRGYGVMDKSEYAAHLRILRYVRDKERVFHFGSKVEYYGGTSTLPGDNDSVGSTDYQAGMALRRSRLIETDPNGLWRLSKYGRIYLEQRDRSNPLGLSSTDLLTAAGIVAVVGTIGYLIWKSSQDSALAAQATAAAQAAPQTSIMQPFTATNLVANPAPVPAPNPNSAGGGVPLPVAPTA